MGLPGGAWINALKDSIHRNEPDESEFRVWWRGEGRRTIERTFPLAS
jgi:hypothetical protein